MATHTGQGFAAEVLAEAGSESLQLCFNCGTCTGACPVSWLDRDYNPRRILKWIAQGERDRVLSSPVVWLCSACDICYRRCPQQVHLSALMKAVRTLAIREGIDPPGTPAQANLRRCASCAQCVRACPYEAIALEPVWVNGRQHLVVPQVDAQLCTQCGVCTAVCPVSAIRAPDLGDETLIGKMKEFAYNGVYANQAASDWQPHLVVLLCGWCLYSDLDRADVAKVEAEPGVQVVRIPCLGRMDPMHVLMALQDGVDGVLVVGCHLGNCHYRHGNFMAEKRIAVLTAVLSVAGEENRVRFAHVSSAERGVLPRLLREMHGEVEALGPIAAGSRMNRYGGRLTREAREELLHRAAVPLTSVD